MKVVHLLSSTAHGQLAHGNLTAGSRGVTGSESSMMFLARESALRNHRVVVYLPTEEETVHQGVTYLDYTRAYPRLRETEGADVVVSWLTSDHLVRCRPDQLRVHSIQINDWRLCSAWEPNMGHVDVFVCVTKAHQGWLWKAFAHPEGTERVEIVPNGVDLSRFAIKLPRKERRLVYCSSPDRGLHWMLYLWPDIRTAYPDAELHVYYEIKQWVEGAYRDMTEIGQRARYVADKLRKLEGHGVILHGAVSPVQLAKDLLQSDLMTYPLDPVSSTEGFSVSTMEACAAGCVPVVTDADAFKELYSASGAVMIDRGEGGAEWVDEYREQVLQLLKPESRPEIEARRELVRKFAAQYDWSVVGEQWHQMLDRRMAMKKSNPTPLKATGFSRPLRGPEEQQGSGPQFPPEGGAA